MRGIVYSTKTAAVPGSNQPGPVILEIWFEDLKICVNQNNEVFRYNGPRKALNHFGSMDFPAGFTDLVKKCIDAREALEGSNPKVFTALKKKLLPHKGKHFSMDSP